MSVAEPTSTPPVAPPKIGHPKGFWFIFFGELAERSSFYGMKTLLTFYLIHVFVFAKHQATEVAHLYIAGCYATGLIGGFIADRFLGKYWTIVLFAVPYIVGQFLIGLSDMTLLYAALFILAFGSGIIKPNISTLMGMTYDQQRPGQDQLRTRAFGYFYMAINIGSFLSQIICPALRDYFGQVDPNTGTPATAESAKAGYLAGFLFPAFLMIAALLLFAAGKRFYAKEDVKANRAADASAAENKWKVVGRLGVLFTLVLFFWVIFDQHSTTWIYFANDYLGLQFHLDAPVGFPDVKLYKLPLGLPAGDHRIPPESIQAANPFLIVLFVPLLNWLFAVLARKGVRVRPTDKMTVGFFLTAAGCAMHVAAGYLATNPDGSITKVSVLWQIGAYVLLTVAEVLISVTGLELAFTAAPKSLKSFVTGLWLVPVFLANVLASQLAKTYPSAVKEGEVVKAPLFNPFGLELFTIPQFPTAQGYFLAMTITLLVVTGAFVFVAKRFNRTEVKQTLDEQKKDVSAAE